MTTHAAVKRTLEIAGFAFDAHLNHAPLPYRRPGQLGGGGDDLGLIARAVGKSTIVLHRPGAFVLYDPKYER